MKTIINTLLTGFLLFAPVSLLAQQDSIRLLCPMNNAVLVKSPKQPMFFDTPEMSVVLSSPTDSLVLSCYNAQVTNIETDEDGKFGVVLFCKYKNKDYYFWYTGLSKLNVRRLDKIKAGQTIGYIQPGDKLELLMYDFETPVDVLLYLECKNELMK